MKSTERSLNKNRLPSHSIAAFGYIGCISSMLSQSSFVLPHSVKRRARYPRVMSDFELFDNDNQMPIDWMKSPINELSRKVMRSRPTTRASVNDIITGNDIYVEANHANAIDFVNLHSTTLN